MTKDAWKKNQSILRNKFESLGYNTTLVHSDFVRSLDYAEYTKDKDKLICNHIDLLEKLAPCVVYPSFNYDFPKTHSFDYHNFKCQVGAIPEYFRKNYPCIRTFDPMFSFASTSFKQKVGDYKPLVTTFKKEDAFQIFTRKQSAILNYGTGNNFAAMTILHYFELFVSVPYRYFKNFSGTCTINSQILPLEYQSHFRPWGFTLNYDVQKIQDDLIREGIIINMSKFCSITDGYQLHEYLLLRLKDDIFYFLEKDTVTRVKRKLDQLGRPFTQKDFE